MIEKKTVWAVTHELEIAKRVAIVEDGEVLMSKDPDNEESGYKKGYDITRYFDTEALAKEWAKEREQYVRDMVLEVRDFILDMDANYRLRSKLGIKKEDYLGTYRSSSNYEEAYDKEYDYARKLETFIKSRMLNIDGCMIPIDQVRKVKWYSVTDADECSECEWKAVLTTASGDDYSTGSEEDVRLIWATIGKCIGLRIIDDEINYDKSDND